MLSLYPPHFTALTRKQQVLWLHVALNGPVKSRASDLAKELGGGSQHYPGLIKVLCDSGFLVKSGQNEELIRVCNREEHRLVQAPPRGNKERYD